MLNVAATPVLLYRSRLVASSNNSRNAPPPMDQALEIMVKMKYLRLA